MSDYMLMLESHLNGEQTRVLNVVQQASAEAGANLFLSGGAMRDIIGGFPVRDLDFTVEGPALKVAKAAAEHGRGTIISQDDLRKTAELVFPGGVTAQIAMSRVEKHSKPGSKPQVTAASIHEDLRGRDFTINATPISLNRASRAPLLAPANGLADLGRRELRSVHPYIFYDDAVRLVRLIRFKVRFGFTVETRTQSQYENARLAEMENGIAPRAWLGELREIANELNPAEVLQALDNERLLKHVSPALTGDKLNLPGFLKLQKARLAAPFGTGFRYDPVPLFFSTLTENLTPRKPPALIPPLHLNKAEIAPWKDIQ